MGAALRHPCGERTCVVVLRLTRQTISGKKHEAPVP